MSDTPRWVVLLPTESTLRPGTAHRDLASACHVAASVPWHPALLAAAGATPRFDALDRPTPPDAGEFRVLPEGWDEALASGHRTQAADAGAVWLVAGSDRAATLADWAGRVAGLDHPPRSDEIVRDFLALGTTCWFLEAIARAMGHPAALDRDLLACEILPGALAWRDGDPASAAGRLRAAFELLTQAREKFYPVDDYLIDVVLLDTATPAGALAGIFERHVPFTILATGRAIEVLAAIDPNAMRSLRDAVSEEWADVVGGSYDEADEGRLPVESVLWQYRRGAEAYARHLDGRGVETWARRRFGLHPMVPQLARRHGLRYAWHVAFDGGRFPVAPETKRLWESPDGATLETLFRPPLAADDPTSALTLPATLARSLKTDHVAAVPFLHWPTPVAEWFTDLRRSAMYSPVLGRWSTLGRFFELSDRPWDLFRATLDEYHPPYFADALRSGASDPISRPARHARLRARLDALTTLQACAAAFDALARGAARPSAESEPPPFDATPAPLADAESSLETGNLEAAESRLAEAERSVPAAVAAHLEPPSESGDPEAGYLILNPCDAPRRAVVVLPDAPLDQAPVGPLRAAQFTDRGVAGVVDLPAFGFVWVPRRTPAPEAAPRPALVRALGRTLANEWIEVTFDERTGGLRSIHRPGEPTPRLAQQLVATGLGGTTTMSATAIDIDYAGPAVAQIVSRGMVAAPGAPDRPIAHFRQTARLWSGRPILELSIELDEIDPELRTTNSEGETPALACRWAWADAAATVRRSWFHNLETTRSIDADTPEAIVVESRNQHSALLFGGLSRHRRHGARMLDTWLVSGSEASPSFELGVVLDLEHPARALADWLAPAPVVPLDRPPPPGGESGWFFRLDHRGVAVTRVAYAPLTADGRGWGLTFHLLETLGQPARCRLRLFRDPVGARLVDLQGDRIMDVPVQGDSVQIDLTPRELACVEATLGLY
jgi:alpha-mannosidase